MTKRRAGRTATAGERAGERLKAMHAARRHMKQARVREPVVDLCGTRKACCPRCAGEKTVLHAWSDRETGAAGLKRETCPRCAGEGRVAV